MSVTFGHLRAGYMWHWHVSPVVETCRMVNHTQSGEQKFSQQFATERHVLNGIRWGFSPGCQRPLSIINLQFLLVKKKKKESKLLWSFTGKIVCWSFLRTSWVCCASIMSGNLFEEVHYAEVEDCQGWGSSRLWRCLDGPVLMLSVKAVA